LVQTKEEGGEIVVGLCWSLMS